MPVVNTCYCVCVLKTMLYVCVENSSQFSADPENCWSLKLTFRWPWCVLRNQADLQLTFMCMLKNEAFSWLWCLSRSQADLEVTDFQSDFDACSEESNQLSAWSWCVCSTIKPTFSLTLRWVEESSRLSAWSEPVSFPLWKKKSEKAC